MSIAGDLLTTATPARLLCRRGTWVLELVKLVAVERNVFQPKVTRLEGAEAVLQHLKRMGDSPALAAAASQLMRGPRLDDERAFDAVDGDWVPGEPSRRDSTRPSAFPSGGGISGEVAELRAEVLVLRASHERLRERVQRLESQVLATNRSQDVLSIPPTPSIVMPKVSEASVSPRPLTFPPSRAPVAATRVSRAGSSAAVPAGVSLPTADEITASLQALIGDGVSVSEKHPVTFAADALGACWVSRLIDDEGADVGAIVVNRAAATTLGGALIALPEHEIEEQRSLDSPSEDVIGAMGEVSNSLCEAINQAGGGTQVRAKPIEPLMSGLLDWVESSGRGVELELNDGVGRLFLFAR